ncbi:UNVERIFIED_ORG: DNA (cytosine-5)-methyltransferase 1 [Zoogloea ramigera]|uniref:Cytosine-specific methyltransferase n=1 Tax=Duganella zoogloeoides TaxID=75659 RepID=A0ABZ0XZT7_9BURK|nr:DNA cytosine methyltransferase [Duganella zoogloeoides]WQH04742.1 DNA cytosine methyltransferase [Duganella zoogloeoides]
MPRSSAKPLTFIDAFAGCGGLSLGLMQAGLKGRFAIERDKFAFATLKANLLAKGSPYKYVWPRWLPQEPIGIVELLEKHREKLEQLSGTVDVLVGGPPCQGFSAAGRRQHDDPRNQLFASYLNLVDIIKPKAVLIENVRGFTQDFSDGDEIKNFSQALKARLSTAYTVHEKLLNLSIFGVPQARTRYFILAIRSDLNAPDPFVHLQNRLPNFLRSLRLTAPVSSGAAISDLEVSRNGTRLSIESKGFQETCYSGPETHYQKLMNAGCEAPTDLRLARHAEEIAVRFKSIIQLSHSEGRLNTSIGAEMRARFGLKKMALRVLDPDRPSPTITSMPDDLLHYSEARTLTVRENARLQSFPDWYSFQGKYTTGGHRRKQEVPRFTQVANAVPPLVARAIGKTLTELLKDEPVTSTAFKAIEASGLHAAQQAPKLSAQN